MAVWGSIWGARPEEGARPFPCDGLIEGASQIWLRGVDIAAPPGLAFLWLCQMRVAPYSYDWIDNLGRRSPQRLIAGLDDLAAGQTVMTIFKLTSFEKDRHLTLVSKDSGLLPKFAKLAISYLIVPQSAQSCRLLVKAEVAYPRHLLGWLSKTFLPMGDWIMMRRQLLNFKRLAERDASRAEK